MLAARTATAVTLLLALSCSASRAASETVAYTFGPYPFPFTTSPASGCYPDSPPLGGPGGTVFYGTTEKCGILADGSAAAGVLYKLARSKGQSAASYTVLHSFDVATEGSLPIGVPATDGHSLYGTLFIGPGSSGGGSVYRWTPPAAGKTGGTLTILHFFGGAGDGKLPQGTLYRAVDGTLYGTTSFDSAGANGLVYSLAPPAAGQSAWTYTILHTFTGPDGSMPNGGLVQDASGTLYGAAELGGPAGHGTIFALTPPAPGATAWTETTLTAFPSATDPATPNGSLLFDAAGALYGTSGGGGSDNGGTVFKLTPPASAGAPWTPTTLLSFTSTNGRQPTGPVIADASGTLYGTTQLGGLHNRGIVFSLAPPAAGRTSWTEIDLIDFLAGTAPRGSEPSGGLDFTANGQLLGVTPDFGANDTGVLYLVKP